MFAKGGILPLIQQLKLQKQEELRQESIVNGFVTRLQLNAEAMRYFIDFTKSNKLFQKSQNSNPSMRSSKSLRSKDQLKNALSNYHDKQNQILNKAYTSQSNQKLQDSPKIENTTISDGQTPLRSNRSFSPGREYYEKYIHESNKKVQQVQMKAKERYLPFKESKTKHFKQRYQQHFEKLEELDKQEQLKRFDKRQGELDSVDFLYKIRKQKEEERKSSSQQPQHENIYSQKLHTLNSMASHKVLFNPDQFQISSLKKIVKPHRKGTEIPTVQFSNQLTIAPNQVYNYDGSDTGDGFQMKPGRSRNLSFQHQNSQKVVYVTSQRTLLRKHPSNSIKVSKNITQSFRKGSELSINFQTSTNYVNREMSRQIYQEPYQYTDTDRLVCRKTRLSNLLKMKKNPYESFDE